MLQASAEDWNRGNLDGFLSTYLDSPETTFMTGPGLIHGLDPIRQRYREHYFTAGALPPQLLRFDSLVVRPLGGDYALATGRYILTDRKTGAPAGNGNFSLVLRRTTAGWKIIHDHSSAG
ncbi:MAG TPA: nuclear transport factor 2 family protein [Longimicrobiales bacterium]